MVGTKMPRLTSPKPKRRPKPTPRPKPRKKSPVNSVSPVIRRLRRYPHTGYLIPNPILPLIVIESPSPKRIRSPHKKTSSTPRKRRRSPNKTHKLKKRN